MCGFAFFITDGDADVVVGFLEFEGRFGDGSAVAVSKVACVAWACAECDGGNGQGGMDLFLFALAIDSSICAIISFTWSALYLKYRLGKPTRMQIDHICKRIMKIDFSLFNEAIDPAKSLPKAVVIVQK